MSRGGFFKRRRQRKGRAGREGWYFHPSPAPALNSPAPGAWRRSGPPTPPDHPRRAWQGPARPPHTSPTSAALPRTIRPHRVRGRRSGRGAHTSLKLLASSLPRLPPLRLSAPGPGRPMPAPAPPAWLHKVAEKPPPARARREGPHRFPGTAGNAALATRLASRARWTAGPVVAWRTPSCSPLQPAPSPTHLSPGPTGWGRGSLGQEFRALRAPLAPRPRSPSSEGQSVRRPRSGAPATCPNFRCPARKLRLPPPSEFLRLGTPGEARPVRPSRCCRRRRRSLRLASGRRLRCHRAPRPAPRLSLSLRTHFPRRPAEGSTHRRGPAPPRPPVGLPRRPLGNVVFAAALPGTQGFVVPLCGPKAIYRDL